jgi:deoxyribonuclease I
MRIAPLTALICLLLPLSVAATPANFGQAKLEARQYIYYDRHTQGDAYCGCNWTWTGRSGGRVDLAGCGYQVRAQANRAQRIE